MAQIGKTNNLKIVKQVDIGLVLDGGSTGEVILPRSHLPETWEANTFIDVFVYQDSEGRVTATTDEVLAEVGRCAHLAVVDTSSFGAFMDMGLPKDLLVPFKEQQVPMQKGKSYTVYLYNDSSGRIAASSKLSSRVPEVTDGSFKVGQEVSLHVASRSEIGFKAVIDGTHLGLVHNNEILTDVYVGDVYTGWIHSVRDDGKINLTFIPKTRMIRDEVSQTILDHLESRGGVSTVTDKSDPKIILQTFGCSKGAFKKALGKLYKDRVVTITKDAIRLV